MTFNKAPGSEGLPVVVNSLNVVFQKGLLADKQGRANVILMLKPSKEHRHLKNWRHIDKAKWCCVI